MAEPIMAQTVNTVKLTSRASVKIGDSYFTFEATEEHTVPDTVMSAEDFADFKNKIWDDVNSEVDNQIIETKDFLSKKSKATKIAT